MLTQNCEKVELWDVNSKLREKLNCDINEKVELQDINSELY